MAGHSRRFARQLDLLERRSPRLGGAVAALAAPGRGWLRLPAALALIVGGLLGFLPILGFWMLPLGVMLLAVDVPPLRPSVAAAAVRIRALLRRWRTPS
ncbi:MAG: tryptophan synthase subunit beta [Rhodobacter sp.]|nr:tryptophan synthase subunit beta [Paracoccaceae bacterium]MCC0076053.1 tryptophan synthase subunit beta [Rhodobacter sp.]